MNNRAILVNYSFDWRAVPLSAWASTGISIEDLGLIPVESRLESIFTQIKNTKARTPEGLVEFLATEGHTSPFRHIHLMYIITSDIATHIQFLKHRVGVEINSESARYKRLSETYYVPDDLPSEVKAKIEAHNRNSHNLYTEIYQDLIEAGYSKGRAKEASRYVLPYSKQLTYFVTLSLQALAHLYKLRVSPHAQKEIRDIVNSMVLQLEQTGKFDPVMPFVRGESWN